MKNQNLPPILIIGISFLLFGLSATAFCEHHNPWYENNDRGNRYEGQRSFPVSAAPIELVSFFSFREEYALDDTSDDTLKVRFYLNETPRNSSDISITAQVSITAQELHQWRYYWMEVKPQAWHEGWNEFGPWPVSTVLRMLNIPTYNLGVLVRLQPGSGTGTISPAVIYHSSPPSEIEQYTAYFRPGMSLDRGTYTIYDEYIGNELLDEGVIGRQDAEIPFPIIFNLPTDWEGLVRLRIVVFRPGSTRPVIRDYCFYHKQPVFE